jgi:hypothetical protein
MRASTVHAPTTCARVHQHHATPPPRRSLTCGCLILEGPISSLRGMSGGSWAAAAAVGRAGAPRCRCARYCGGAGGALGDTPAAVTGKRACALLSPPSVLSPDESDAAGACSGCLACWPAPRACHPSRLAGTSAPLAAVVQRLSSSTHASSASVPHLGIRRPIYAFTTSGAMFMHPAPPPPGVFFRSHPVKR